MNHQRSRKFSGGYARNVRASGPPSNFGSPGPGYFGNSGGPPQSWHSGPRHVAPPFGRGYNRGGHGGFQSRGFSGPRGSFRPYNNRGGTRNDGEQMKSARGIVGRRLCEEEVGVTEYISDLPGFTGVIKSRFSDFQVSEINLNGEVAKLTDMSVPQKSVKDEIAEDEELVSKYNLEVIPTETWDKINALVVNPEPTTDTVQIDVTGMSKEHRTKIHDAVKKAFGNAIVGSTVGTDDKKFVKFAKFRKGIRIDNRVKWTWPGEFVHMIVHKKNCDTNEAANLISERLQLSCNVKSSMLGYAGTKDRRAVTSQWFSLRRTEPARIAKSCRHIRSVQIGNYTFRDHELKLGMLRGNRFRIALRNVTADDEIVAKACESLRDRGFINYYGLQRFGTCYHTPTHAVGIKILQGNFRDAIDAILEVRPGPLEEALKHYKEYRDAEEAYSLLGYSNQTVEGKLLAALCRDPKDLVGALAKIPRNVRLLYAHAYQSFVFNKCASERVRRFGYKPAVGDLVLADKQEQLLDAEDEQAGESDNDEQCEQEGVKLGVEQEIKGADDKTATLTTDITSNGSQKFKKAPADVKVLSEEDISSDRYSILDVILPLPGCDIQYPPNLQDYYQEVLSKDKVTLDMKNNIKAYNLSGVYRTLVVRPISLTWTSVRFSDPLGDLILSDADELAGTTLDAVREDGKFKAVILDVSLPSSSYATMALRELMKVDTSGEGQAARNNYADEQKVIEAAEAENKDNEAETEVENKNKELGTEAEKKDEEETQIEMKEEAQIIEEAQKTDEAEERKLDDSHEEPDAKKTKRDA